VLGRGFVPNLGWSKVIALPLKLMHFTPTTNILLFLLSVKRNLEINDYNFSCKR
jgi:hypothetical protein